MTPQEFARQCALLASLKGTASVGLVGKVTYTGYRYASAAIRVQVEAGDISIHGLGQRTSEHTPSEFLLMQQHAGKLRLNYGDLYLHWVDVVAQGLRGTPATAPVDLGSMASLGMITQELSA